MIIKRFFCCALFAAICPLGVAVAQVQTPMSVQQLQALCDSRYDVDVGVCAGYVAAIAEKIMADTRPDTRACLNPAVTPEALVANVQEAWKVDRPTASDPAFGAVEGALRRRFRCI